MPSVQFFGIDQVITAAENIKCASWAIFAGRAMLFKHEGTDEDTSMNYLEQTLEMLAKTTSTTAYLLKFFEPVNGNAPKINEKTPVTAGSFNFKLIDSDEREQRYIGYLQNTTQSKEVESLKEQIQELKQMIKEKPEPEEPQTLGSILIDCLKYPEQGMQLVQLGRMILGLPVQAVPASVGAIPQQQLSEGEQEALANRLANALDHLEKADPKIVEHLEALAKMSKENPAMFNTALSFLK